MTSTSALSQAGVAHGWATNPDYCSQSKNHSWVHLCNGLDPVRDGGMVPSILGMTGALARLHSTVTIVTPTPSRLNDTLIPGGVVLRGPETNLEASVRRRRGHSSARSVAGTHTPGCSHSSGCSHPLPDHHSRHDGAVGPAHRALEEMGLPRIS